MIKWLSVVLLAMCCCFDSQAVVVQSGSNALSYKIMAKSSNSSRVSPPAVQARNKEIDLSSAFSSKVFLDKGDTAIVTIKDDACCTWKIKYDSIAVSATNKGQVNNIRTFTFRQLVPERESTVYFDNIDKKDKSVKATKALYIKCF